ncbi:MAG: EamA family transporter [Candidatus Vogelbacteria bacterium]|nr:EamA family transporter [Candidatus Vogelbacteria bacterium]
MNKRKKSPLLGLLGVLGIAVTAGLALPFVNVLSQFQPEELMAFRGFLTASIALALLGGKIRKVDNYTYWIAAVLPLATLGLFNGIRYWGPNQTIVLIMATPLVNFAIGFFLKRKPSLASIVGLVLLLIGVTTALWDELFVLIGFKWALFGTLMNGVLYELFARARAESLQKCFYATIAMGTLGLILSLGTDTSWAQAVNSRTAITLFCFALVGGFLYWRANLLAFENLPVAEASILAQLETPATIIGSYFFLGQHFTNGQWASVAIAFFGASLLAFWLAKQTEQEKHN